MPESLYSSYLSNSWPFHDTHAYYNYIWALIVVLEYFGVMSNTVSRLGSAGYVHT